MLVTGTKYYGVHLGPLKTPMRETDPRHMPPDFYFDQIDWLTDFQRGKKWSLSELRPQTLCGFAPGAAMSIMPAHRRLCRDLEGTRPAAALSRQAGRLRYDLPGDRVLALRQCRPVGRDRAARRQPGLQHHQRRLFPLAQRVAENRRRVRHEGGRGADHQPHPAHGRQGRAVGAAREEARPQEDRPSTSSSPGRSLDYVFAADWDVMSDVTKSRLHGFHDVVDSEAMFERLLRRFRREKIVP